MQSVVIGDCTLFLGDCIEVMQHLETVNHVITDPPYEAEAHTKGRRLLGKMDSRVGKHRRIDNLAIDFCQMDEALRAQASKSIQALARGWSLIFCQVEGVHLWMQAMSGSKYKRTGIWVKPDGAPQFTGDRPGMGYESIVMHWNGEGRSRWNGGGKHGVFTCGKSDAGYGHGGLLNEHPTKKPIKLMKELVTLFSRSGETILDPFMGSGSTGVACIQLGRKFIGIEKDPHYFQVACERIKNAYAQPDLFINQTKE